MANYSICNIDGCANPEKAGGLCSAHYQRMRKFGDPLRGGLVKQVPIAECAHEGCEAVANIGGGSKGFCNKHYVRFKKFGHSGVSMLDRETDACRVDGCGRGKPLSLGLCQKHYVRLKNHGTTDLPDDGRIGRKDRWIKRHVGFVGDECLIWPFGVGDNGRGVAAIDGKITSAPRVMCILAHGHPPDEAMHAAHSCGNGHGGCVNPRHLSWKTAQENEADKVAHGTLRKGAQINTNKLTEHQVREIRTAWDAGLNGPTLARRYGVTPSTIWSIATRKSWAWLE